MSYSDDINAFLDAYSPGAVEAALEDRERHLSEQRTKGAWTPWTGEGIPAPPLEWRRLPNGKIQYREPVAIAAPERAAKTRAVGSTRRPNPKTDTSLQRNPGVTCPWCGSETYREPLCPACKEGRAGMAARIICGDNSDDHIFYVPRGGE